MGLVTQLERRTSKSIELVGYVTPKRYHIWTPIRSFGCSRFVEASLSKLRRFQYICGGNQVIRVLADGKTTGLTLKPEHFINCVRIIFYDDDNKSIKIKGILEDNSIFKTKGPSALRLRQRFCGWFLIRNRNYYFDQMEKEGVGVISIDVQIQDTLDLPPIGYQLRRQPQIRILSNHDAANKAKSDQAAADDKHVLRILNYYARKELKSDQAVVDAGKQKAKSDLVDAWKHKPSSSIT